MKISPKITELSPKITELSPKITKISPKVMQTSPKVSIQQHALKGQKLLAQGNTLGISTIRVAPCKGKSLLFCLEF